MTKGIMKKIALLCVLLVSTTLLAQTQYLLPTGDASMDDKEKPLIEVYLPKKDILLISLYRYQVYHCNRYHASAAIGTVRIAANGTMIIGSA